MGALGLIEWLLLAEPGLAALPVASAPGGVVMEVPQIQFIDAVVLEQFQFLDQFMVGPLLCNDSCRCSLGCSALTGVVHLRDAVAGPLLVLFCAMPGSTANTCSATAPDALVVLL